MPPPILEMSGEGALETKCVQEGFSETRSITYLFVQSTTSFCTYLVTLSSFTTPTDYNRPLHKSGHCIIVFMSNGLVHWWSICSELTIWKVANLRSYWNKGFPTKACIPPEILSSVGLQGTFIALWKLLLAACLTVSILVTKLLYRTSRNLFCLSNGMGISLFCIQWCLDTSLMQRRPWQIITVCMYAHFFHHLAMQNYVMILGRGEEGTNSWKTRSVDKTFYLL